jgi:predicted O-linked N-acetylglucosamine transferase (SPINDLY family)
MERIMYTLAMSRMAPIQCTTWGNPVTTGIATADYFISAEALETLASDGHYTERLVRLKSLAVRYERPPRVPTDRAKFGFDKDSGSTSARRRRTSSMPSEFLRG